MEAKIFEKCPGNFSSCFKYPLKRVLKVHTNDDSKLYFNLYVYNIAGHFAEVQTDPIFLPPRFPPTSGILIETESGHLSSNDDIDYIFQTNKICFDWKGIWHVQNISIEIGLGSSRESVDVQFFKSISNDEKCLNNLQLKPFKKYYTFARATVAGYVQSVVISDGFTVIDKAEVLNALHVRIGTLCGSKNITEIDVAMANTSNVYFVKSKLRENQIYTAIPNDTALTSQDVVWIDEMNKQFVAIVPQPKFYVLNNNPVSILPCQEDKRFQSSKHTLDVFWTFDKTELITHYKVALYKINKDRTETLIETFRNVGKNMQIHLNNLHLQNNQLYRSLVKPCFQKTCLKGKYSKDVLIEEPLHSGNGIEASFIVNQKDTQEVEVNVKFNAYRCGQTHNAIGYAGALYEAIDHHHQLTSWYLMPLNTSYNRFDVSDFYNIYYY